MDRGTWQATVHGTHKRVRHDLATKQQLIILTTPVTYLGQSIVIRCFTFLKPYTINFYKVKQENVELNIQFSSVQFSSFSQSCLTLCNPKDCSLPGSSVHGISQARILDWVAISFSRGSSQPRSQTHDS